MNIEIILPECSEDSISEGLRGLTGILEKHGADLSHGFLGGYWGYGAYFENEVFMMHPYCWCEEDDCPWCYGCECDLDSEVLCDWCRGVHKYGEQGALPPDSPPHKGAPNFWHKPSGFKVWWYKYIGRSMDFQNLPPLDMFAQCVNSIKS